MKLVMLSALDVAGHTLTTGWSPKGTAMDFITGLLNALIKRMVPERNPTLSRQMEV